MADLLDILSRILPAIGTVFMPFLLLPFLILLLPKYLFVQKLQTTICEIIDEFNNWLGEMVKWLLVALVISVAFSVFALSIFGLSWTKLDESAIYFHASVIMLGSAATLLAGGHVRVDIFYSKMSPKAKALVDFIGFYALLAPFCLLLLKDSQSFISLAWSSFEGSAESDGIRGVFLLKTLIPVFAISLLLQGFSLAGRAALLLNGKPLPALPKGTNDPFADEEQEAIL